MRVRYINHTINPRAREVLHEAALASIELTGARVSRVYLIEARVTEPELRRIADELLVDPVIQEAEIVWGKSDTKGNNPVGAADSTPESTGDADPAQADPHHTAIIEVHYKPGVMDPVAESTREAILDLLPRLSSEEVDVRTGDRYDLNWSGDAQTTIQDIHRFGESILANPVIQQIYDHPYHPDRFVHGSPYQIRVTHVPIRELGDDALMKLSRDGHLFLDLAEMRAIRDYYRTLPDPRDPTDIELETLAQTWSEHCVHKTLKSKVHYHPAPGSVPAPGGADGSSSDRYPGPSDWTNRPGHTLHDDGSITIDNLLKSTIAAATKRLMEEDHFKDWCISVFEDNSGIVRFDEHDGVCIKVETHNHPSAIEPYGGAATGIGGCIRDIMGTGLAAKPIANTDVFCVGYPDTRTVPKGVIPPRRTLQRVVAGVRDYGNRMGIPTINGAVWFHRDYIANPLVFAGCVGLIPVDKCFGEPRDGDRIIAVGGRTGRDGIHGATFSSAELTDTHADEFSHAVQIGNPITQKKTLDVLLQARDHPKGCLYRAITDCGAGGFSSAVGEMSQHVGARVTLDTAPLKYRGLSYTEIWISEAQERMVLAVPPENVELFRDLCESEDVELCDLGRFGTTDTNGDPQLILTYQETEVGRLGMEFIHDGLPKPTREARYPGGERIETGLSDPQNGSGFNPVASDGPRESSGGGGGGVTETLYRLLSHPNIASKHWIIRQYDHEVQGGSVVKPLSGSHQDGPGDAAVIRPKPGTTRGVAIGSGLQTGIGEGAVGGDGDSYWMGLAAIDEAVRNVVCVGCDPKRIALLDNFCWPRCDDPEQLGSLARAAEACYDGALGYRAPFISGKDSLSNQFTTESGALIKIPPTLLITAIGMITDVSRCVTMDAKSPGNVLLLVGKTDPAMGGSHYLMVTKDDSVDQRIPRVDLDLGPRTAIAVGRVIERGDIVSAHDCSDGGLLVAAAEMSFAGGIGLDLDLSEMVGGRAPLDPRQLCFSESPSRYLLEVQPDVVDEVVRCLHEAEVPCFRVGVLTDHDRLTACATRDGKREMIVDEAIDHLRATWQKPLDW